MATKNGKQDRKRSPSAGALLAQARETAWDYVGQEAVRRVGRGSQLKGVIHEIAIREKRNLTPDALLSGTRTSVTRSPSTKTVDLITTRNGRVVERIHAKDCISDPYARNVQARGGEGPVPDRPPPRYPGNGREIHNVGGYKDRTISYTLPQALRANRRAVNPVLGIGGKSQNGVAYEMKTGRM